MKLKTFSAAAVTAGFVAFPLVACGSSPAPSVTTVTATPTTLSPGFQKSYCDINSATKDACAKHDADVLRRQTTAQQQSKSSGLPWWSWLLIVPAGLALFAFLAIKLMDANDEQTIARANARVDELDARPRPVVDYDDYENDDEDDAALPEEDIEFLHRVTDPTPSAPVQPAPPAGGGSLLSSLRQQGGAQ